MLWDLIQHTQIDRCNTQSAEAATSARTAVAETRGLNDDMRELQKRFDALSLACAAMWELMTESNRVTDEQLLDKIQELDLKDGVLDGKLAHEPVQCPACPRANHPHRDTCLYCGARLMSGRVFP